MNAAEWLKRRVEQDKLSWDQLARIVELAQAELGVTADGKWGAKSTAALLERLGPQAGTLTPIPKGRAAVKRTYGSFSWEWDGNPKDRWVKADPAWIRKNIKTFVLHDGRKRRLHRLVGDEFVELFRRACEASGYTPKSVQTFNPRLIRAKEGSNLSFHSFGIAVDFDSRANPWGGVQANGEPSLMRQHPDFFRTFEEANWTWGGRWRSNGGKKKVAGIVGAGDDMHFERKQ